MKQAWTVDIRETLGDAPTKTELAEVAKLGDTRELAVLFCTETQARNIRKMKEYAKIKLMVDDKEF